MSPRLALAILLPRVTIEATVRAATNEARPSDRALETAAVLPTPSGDTP